MPVLQLLRGPVAEMGLGDPLVGRAKLSNAWQRACEEAPVKRVQEEMREAFAAFRRG